jgi:hypothetical protein
MGPVACELNWVVGLVGYGSSQEVFFKAQGRTSGCFNADASLPDAGLSSHLEVGGVWYSRMPLSNLRRGNKAAASYDNPTVAPTNNRFDTPYSW